MRTLLLCCAVYLAMNSFARAADKVVVLPFSLDSSYPIYTLGDGNLFIGKNAGNRTMTGTYNTGTGAQVLSGNTEGFANTASGGFALSVNTTGYFNTAIGALALRANTTGYENTASGAYALKANTTGRVNTASGGFALFSNTSGYGNTASGVSSLNQNTTGYFNTADGAGALNQSKVGWHNTAIGGFAGSSTTSGSYNTFVGYNAQAGGTNAGSLYNVTALGINATPTVSNSVRIGNNSVTLIGGHVGWTQISDGRKKKDIKGITYGLDFIKSLRPVEFRMKQGNERVDFGFIAQEIETLLGTKYNVLSIDNDKDRTLSLRYNDFIAPMVKAMQEQDKTIQAQATTIQEQKKTIDTQQNQLAALEERLVLIEKKLAMK